MLATIMPVDGDTANVPDRGAAFADQYLVNPNGAVNAAWLNVINILPLIPTARARWVEKVAEVESMDAAQMWSLPGGQMIILAKNI